MQVRDRRVRIADAIRGLPRLEIHPSYVKSHKPLNSPDRDSSRPIPPVFSTLETECREFQPAECAWGAVLRNALSRTTRMHQQKIARRPHRRTASRSVERQATQTKANLDAAPRRPWINGPGFGVAPGRFPPPRRS